MLKHCRILLLTLSLISGFTVLGQREATTDTSEIVYRHPSAEKIEAYKQMSEYKYDRFEAPESLWDKVLKWFFGLFKDIGIEPNVVKYTLIGISVLILVFIVLKLLGIKPSGLFIFKHDTKVTQLNFKQSDEDIYNQDLDKVLLLSIRNKAYREAVRLQYLICLRHLDQTKKIDWKPWKTNHDYYYEITDKKHNKDFRQLVTNYEYVWYGQFPVDTSLFTEIQNQFETFMSIEKHK